MRGGADELAHCALCVPYLSLACSDSSPIVHPAERSHGGRRGPPMWFLVCSCSTNTCSDPSESERSPVNQRIVCVVSQTDSQTDKRNAHKSDTNRLVVVTYVVTATIYCQERRFLRTAVDLPTYECVVVAIVWLQDYSYLSLASCR